MTLELSKPLQRLLQMAYSAEKAAAFAYQGHAASLSSAQEKSEVHQIEVDEWNHRAEVLLILQEYQIPVSSWFEFRFHIIGKCISYACFVIGRFMPFFFAGKLESGNVCEYFRMIHLFHAEGISKHDPMLFEMGMKEKEHELYFLQKVQSDSLLPLFEKVFKWGVENRLNDVGTPGEVSVEDAGQYCKKEH